MAKENIILEKSFSYAVRVTKMYQYLTKEKKEFVLSKQVLRSGTSVGANVEEAIGGFSKADFNAKMSIAYKECRETLYWLRLLKETEYIDDKIFNSMFNEAEELRKILASIVKTIKETKQKKS
ncbi:MAG: hypothetical protein RL065_2138 [Bacteroidota bacterium]|jgi:four helix bundle protein